MESENETPAADFPRVLAEHGYLMHNTTGYSMYPLLRHHKDVVKIVPATGKLKKWDTALYIRRADGAYILHRVIKVNKDGGYVFSGDNCCYKEYGITDADIVGVLDAIVRNGKTISVHSRGYRFYVFLRCGSFPLKVCVNKCISLARAVKRRLTKQ